VTDYGVTPEGFVKKPFDVIYAELEAEFKSEVDATLDTSPEQPMGQVIGIFARREALMWELLETAYDAFDRDKAEFFLLDTVGALTGCKRKPATYSTVTLTCTTTGSVTFTEGVTKANVTGKPTDVWVAAETKTVGAGSHAIKFRADTKGARAANAGTITVINTPVAGWTVVTNASNASQGQNEEQDTTYRSRQVEELAQAGSSSTVAVRAALIEIDEVIEAKVFENTDRSTDSAGLPPHSMQAVIWDGVTPAASNNEIAQVVWDNKGGGIEFIGSASGTAVDIEGNNRTVKFDRATQKNVYIDITVKQKVGGPTVTAQAVKDALTAKVFTVGEEVVADQLEARVVLNVAGAHSVTVFELGFTASPTGTADLAIGTREIAVLDDSRITVTIV
jgi:uncharacterized phage protein gp47/JayE